MTTHRPDEHLGSRYTLISPINSGAMGEVWRARDAGGGLYAAKILRPGLGDNAEMVKRFVAERNLLLSVHHPNVVGVHDLVVEGDTLAIVMDLVEGRDLRQVLAAVGTFTPSDAALVCAELADGLSAIHEQRIVHRDMKPANVLVDETGEAAVPRITDFGVSRLTEAGPGATNPTLVAGTPHYMAPELLMNQTPTAASDLYSLGIMLYELTTGLTPFADRSPAAAMQAQLNLAPGRPEGVDERLWEVMRWLTHKDPSQRPATAAQAARALGEVSARTEPLPAMVPLVVPPAPVPADVPNATVPAAPGRWPGSGPASWPGAGADGLSAIGFSSARSGPTSGPGTTRAAVSQGAPRGPYSQGPARSRGRSRGDVKTAIIIVLAVLLLVGVGLGIFLLSRSRASNEPTASPSAPATGETTTPTPTPTPTPTVDERTQALDELNDARNRSLQNLVLNGRWVLQLDSKYEGVSDPLQTTSSGSHTFMLPDIYARYQESAQYATSHGMSNVLLLKGGDFGKQIFSLPEDTWVTIADPGGIDSYEAGVAVCSALYPNLSGDQLLNSCLPRQLSEPHT